MVQESVPLPYGQLSKPPATCVPGRKTTHNPFVEVFHHEAVVETAAGPRTKTFTEVGVKDSVSVIVFGLVPETGRFGAVMRWDVKKTGPALTTASGYAHKGDRGDLATTATRVLDLEFGMQVGDMEVAVPLEHTEAPVQAYPNTISAVQQGFMVGVRTWPLVKEGKGLWLEDLFPRSLADRTMWRTRVGNHGPVVAALESVQLWLLQNGLADVWGNPTAAWLDV